MGQSSRIRDSITSASTSRRTVVKAGALAAGATAFGSQVAAQTPAASPSAAAPIVESAVEGVPVAYTTFPEPFASTDGVPGAGSTIRSLILSYSPPPTPRNENQFWQELETRLGVTWEPELVPVDTYNERISTVFAGGDLPELFFLLPSASRPIIYEAIDNDVFHDLTDLVESGGLSEYPNLAAYEQYLWDAARINGRIVGIPKPVLRNNDPTIYRKDWGDKLGFAELADATSMHDMLVAMSKNDPDGNGKEDTWGVCPYGGGWFNFIFNQMFRVPYGWKLNDDGTLTNAIETPEYRLALEFVTRLYQDGAFHPDAASLNVSQSQDLLIGGQSGLHTGGLAGLFGEGLRKKVKSVNPDAILEPLIMPGHDGGKGVTYQSPGIFGQVAISKKVGEDEEKLKEVLRVVNYLVAPFGSEESNFLRYGIPGVHSDESPTGGFVVNEKGTADRSALVYPFLSENFFYYPGQPEETLLAQKFNEQMAEVAVRNPVAGLYSATQGEKGEEIGQYVTDTYTSIVTGRETIDKLDEMISEWKSRGGDDIRQEYQDALAGS